MRRLVPIVCLALVLAACGDDGGDVASPAAAAADDAPEDSAPQESALEDGASTTAPPVTTAPPTTTAPPVPPSFTEPGPYPVGRRTAEIVDAARDGRALPLEILYPAAAADGEFTDYELIAGLGYTSSGALDSPPVASPGDGGFPLVVYSHGNNGFGWVHADLTEHLASHGFVVVAPDHVGNTLLDSFLGTAVDTEVVAADRPLDVSFAITATLDGLAPPLDDIAPVVDPDRIGVVGHSFGGYTALTVAGGDDADDRVDAVVGLAPATGRIDDDQLASVDVPALLVSGTQDITTPIEPNTERPFDLIGGRPLVRVDIVDAGHMTFTDICRFVDLLESLPGVSDEILTLADSYAVEACVPELLDIDVAQDIINHATTAFLLTEVAGDASAAAGVTAEGVGAVAGDDAVYLAPA